MIENRIARRTEVKLDANVSTVLASGQGVITDLSETGAKVQFPGLSVGQRVSIEAFGQDVYGIVAWADPDRFGMKFDQPLRSGPLQSYLARLIAPAPRPMAFPRATQRTVFGRRAA